jgi:hypothetical protein
MKARGNKPAANWRNFVDPVLAKNVLPPVALTREVIDRALIFDTKFFAIYDYALAGPG